MFYTAARSSIIPSTPARARSASKNENNPTTRSAARSGNDGGGERDRTDDPLLAKQVLSQLSYTPA